MGMRLLLLDIILDGICGGRHSRVGKRMHRGGYKKRTSGGHGGNFFSAIFAAALVGCVLALWSHPRTKHNGFRRAVFRKQSTPKPSTAVRHISRSGSSSETNRSMGSVAGQGARHETSAEKLSSSTSEKAAVSTSGVSNGVSEGGEKQKAEQAEKKEPKSAGPKRGTVLTVSRTAYGTSLGNSWRQTCKDGTKYGLDPNNYDSEQQYLDALDTAKFADQFRLCPEMIQKRNRPMCVLLIKYDKRHCTMKKETPDLQLLFPAFGKTVQILTFITRKVSIL